MEPLQRIKKNNQYYDLFFEKVKSRTDQRNYSYLLDRFLCLMPVKTGIIDIGCGTGEHLDYFSSNHYPCTGIEPSKKSREHCISKGLNVIEGSFETIKEDCKTFEHTIGGVWCAATLLHVPIEDFEKTIRDLFDILEKDGVLFFTVRLGNKAKWDKYDDETTNVERFIQLYEENFLEKTLNSVGFVTSLKLIEDSYWGRPSKWISMILTK